MLNSLRALRRAISRSSAKCSDGSSSHRRNAHQAAHVQAEIVPAGGDQRVGVLGKDAGLLRLLAGVDLHEHVGDAAFGASRFGDGARRFRGRSMLSITSNRRTARRTLLRCRGPIRCRTISARRSSAPATCPRLPARGSRRRRDGRRPAPVPSPTPGWVLETATSVTSSGARPASRAAAAISASTAARLPATSGASAAVSAGSLGVTSGLQVLVVVNVSGPTLAEVARRLKRPRSAGGLAAAHPDDGQPAAARSAARGASASFRQCRHRARDRARAAASLWSASCSRCAGAGASACWWRPTKIWLAKPTACICRRTMVRAARGAGGFRAAPARWSPRRRIPRARSAGRRRWGSTPCLLAPVFATASHPQARPIGPLCFARLAADQPVACLRARRHRRGGERDDC